MALSMDEQRVLAEIERRLAADDPGLATCLTSFRRPGPVTVLRSPRARIVGSLFTVLLVAMVSLMVYAMIPFRTQHGGRPPASSTPTQSKVTASAPGAFLQPQKTQPVVASASADGVGPRSPARSASSSASTSANTSSTRTQAAGYAIPPGGP